MWEGGFQLVKFFRFFKRKTFILALILWCMFSTQLTACVFITPKSPTGNYRRLKKYTDLGEVKIITELKYKKYKENKIYN